MFKIGDEVICIVDGEDLWITQESCEPIDGPKNREELIVHIIEKDGRLTFKKYTCPPGDGFPTCFFRKKEKKPFTNKLTKKLANKPIVKETSEKIEKIELV